MLIKVLLEAEVHLLQIRRDEHDDKALDLGRDAASEQTWNAWAVLAVDFEFSGKEHSGAVGAIGDEGIAA